MSPPSTLNRCARGHRPRRRLLRFGLTCCGHREAAACALLCTHALPTARRAGLGECPSSTHILDVYPRAHPSSARRVPLEGTLEYPPSTQWFRRRWFTAGGVRLTAMRAALPMAFASDRIESVPRARPDCVGQQWRRIGRSSSHRTRGAPAAGVGRSGAAACCNRAQQVCATTKATDAVAGPSLLLLRFTSYLSIRDIR